VSNFGNFAIAHIYITKHSNKKLHPKCSLFDIKPFSLQFQFFLLLAPSCKCNLECMYTRVYSWSLWYQIIQLSSQIDTFFSFSLLQNFHPKPTFKTLSNGGLYDQLENVMLIKRQWHFLESRRKKVIFGIKSLSLPLFPGLKAEVWVMIVKRKIFHWNQKENIVFRILMEIQIQNVEKYRILLLLKRWGFLSQVLFMPCSDLKKFRGREKKLETGFRFVIGS